MALGDPIPTVPQPLQPIDQLKAKIAEFSAELVKVHPQHKTLLLEIHRRLHADEQLSYLLSPDEIGKIVSGLQNLAQQKIVQEKVKAASKRSGKSLSNTNLDDI